jgi:phage gp29-like protein
MNIRPFTIVSHNHTRLIPDDGETMGAELKRAAEHREKELTQMQGGVLNDQARRILGQLYHLAADAYDYGASASIGHNRTERYMHQSRELRAKAESLTMLCVD